MNKNATNNFKGADKDTFCILYIIEEIKDIENIKNKISNVIVGDISKFEKEQEVLVFPFTCFEIVNIKEIKNNKIDYEIYLKYLGNYSKLIKEQFDTNFFDRIEVSNFSQELIESGIIENLNFFLSWEKRKEIIINLDTIYFFLDANEDCICSSNNEIIILNVITLKTKQKIKIHKDKILDIKKLTSNRISSCSKDGKIKIFKIKENNYSYEILNTICMNMNYAVKIFFSSKEDILCYDFSNNILFYTLKENKYVNEIDKCFSEVGQILIMKKLINDNIVYITEDSEGNKIVKFIDISQKIKDYNNYYQIEEKNKKLKVMDLFVFYDYLIIGYDYRIDIINYLKKPFITKSLEYFNFLITNIIKLSSNRIILGLYDSKNKESIIREHILRIEDLQNNKDKFESIGLGKLENENIENIIKINESQLLINIKNKSCFIYERKNEMGEKLNNKLINNQDFMKEFNDFDNNINAKLNLNEKPKNIDLIYSNFENINNMEENPLEEVKNSINFSKNNTDNEDNIYNFNQTQNMIIDNNYQKLSYNNNINNNINNNSIYENKNPYSFPNNFNMQKNIFSYDNEIYIKNKSENLNIKNIESNKINLKKINLEPKEKYNKFESKILLSFFPKANNEKLGDTPDKNKYLNNSNYSFETTI